jgi:hypothetical protein
MVFVSASQMLPQEISRTWRQIRYATGSTCSEATVSMSGSLGPLKQARHPPPLVLASLSGHYLYRANKPIHFPRIYLLLCSYIVMFFRTAVQSAFPSSQIVLPWRWRRGVPPKRQFSQDPHGATSQKMALFIVTTVKSYITFRVSSMLASLEQTCQWRFLFVIPFYLQSVLVHSANCVKTCTPTHLGTYQIRLSEGISKYQQLKKKSAATGLNTALASAHTQMT